ncbi:putative Type II CAAX prenyl endopeptidase Rce1 [Helianthus annuus]|nr:putative Type II CAAX prenyl endopeptidase Rce1 [Helianthus annuus]
MYETHHTRRIYSFCCKKYVSLLQIINLTMQVMLLWITSFWLVGSWIIPFVAHTAGFRKEYLTYRGQALYSLLTDIVEGVTGIAILKLCLSSFRPLSSDWFKFSFKGNWHFDVGLGCLMFPLVNRLSQVNLNLVPMPPPTPITVSNVEQSIVARDPMAMLLYAIVVSVCAPIWEEIVFRGFLLPSLTRYMPVWCSILVSSIAFALAHFNMQRMLPLVFLGMVMVRFLHGRETCYRLCCYIAFGTPLYLLIL